MSGLALRTTLAVVLAGIVGTLANAVARALGGGMDKLSLALVPGRYAVAIAVCAPFPSSAAISTAPASGSPRFPCW